MKGDEVAHVGVERPRQHDAPVGIKQRGAHDCGQSVEIGVLMGRDDRLDIEQ